MTGLEEAANVDNFKGKRYVISITDPSSVWNIVKKKIGGNRTIFPKFQFSNICCIFYFSTFSSHFYQNSFEVKFIWRRYIKSIIIQLYCRWCGKYCYDYRYYSFIQIDYWNHVRLYYTSWNHETTNHLSNHAIS